MALCFQVWNPVLHTSPDAAVAMAGLGVCLIFVELNRPGSILPGSVGLCLSLFSVAALVHFHLRGWAISLAVLACMLLALNLWHKVAVPWLLAAVAALIVALHFCVLPGSGSGQYVSVGAAMSTGGLCGAFAATLSRIAYRARKAKAVH